MANTVNYLGYSHAPSGDQSHVGKYGITLTGSYVNGTGEVINLLTATNQNGYELNGMVPMGSTDEPTPEVVGSNIVGYEIGLSNYSAGTFTLKLYASSGTANEFASGAYPTGVLNVTNAIVVAVPNRV